MKFYAFLTLITLSLPALVAQEDTQSAVTSYPQRLITDFPNIYCDTIYTNHKCYIVARAVWKTNHNRPVKVTSDTLSLNASDNCHVVRFKSPSKNGKPKKY